METEISPLAINENFFQTHLPFLEELGVITKKEKMLVIRLLKDDGIPTAYYALRILLVFDARKE